MNFDSIASLEIYLAACGYEGQVWQGWGNETGGRGPRGMGRSGTRHNKTAGGIAVGAEEAARRDRQRALQTLARELQSQGRSYKPGQWRIGRAENVVAGCERTAENARRIAERLSRRCEVVVLPIFWEARQREKGKVEEVCEEVVERLVAAGVRARMDATAATPGKRMAVWEQRGVRVRVEVGPEEAAKGKVVVAVQGKGEMRGGRIMAARKQVRVDKVAAAVMAALGRGEEVVEEEEEEEPVANEIDQKKLGDSSDDDEQLAERGPPPTAPGGPPTARGGDDLDDFELDEDKSETEEEKKERKKKKAKRKR